VLTVIIGLLVVTIWGHPTAKLRQVNAMQDPSTATRTPTLTRPDILAPPYSTSHPTAISPDGPLAGGCVPTGYTFFEYSSFTYDTNLCISGEASLQIPVLNMIKDRSGKDAAIFHAQSMNVLYGFSTEFSLSVSSPVAPAISADGFAFVIQSSSTWTHVVYDGLSGGCGIGYKNIHQEIAIEFDTFQNAYGVPNSGCPELMDPAYPHVGIQGSENNGWPWAISPSHDPIKYSSLITPVQMPNIADGVIRPYKITFTPLGSGGGLLEVYIGSTRYASMVLYLQNYIRGTTAYVGFTAGSGVHVEDINIHSWKFQTCPSPIPTITPSMTVTSTPSNTRTPSVTRTPNGSETATQTTTATHTPTRTPTFSRTPTWTRTPTLTRTFTPTKTYTITKTPTATYTFPSSVTSSWTPNVNENEIVCRNLEIELKARRQPFGPKNPNASPPYTQPEFPEGLTLRYYPDYHQKNTNYWPSDLIMYSDTNLIGQKAVPCGFQNAQGQWVYDREGNVITRFGGDEELRLLAYANYFTHISASWCSTAQNPIPDGTPVAIGDPGDNVFDRPAFANVVGANGDKTSPNRAVPAAFRAGYNVPPIWTNCTDGRLQNTINPCGTFIASVYRAMGYFDVRAFTDYDESKIDYHYWAEGLSNIYYGPGSPGGGIIRSLRTNKSRPGSNIPAYIYEYTPLTLYFLANGQRQYSVWWEETVNDKKVTKFDDANAGGNWGGSYAVRERTVASDIKKTGQNVPPSNDPFYDSMWSSIKPGDLVINVIDAVPKDDPGNLDFRRRYTHVELVVGWGYRNYTDFINSGRRLYSDYNEIPSTERHNYVPYVIDRGWGDGPFDFANRGPRPYDYNILATRADFWIANQ
jgi:hypothetical protein